MKLGITQAIISRWDLPSIKKSIADVKFEEVEQVIETIGRLYDLSSRDKIWKRSKP